MDVCLLFAVCCAGSALNHDSNYSFRGVLQRVCNASEYVRPRNFNSEVALTPHKGKIKKNEWVFRFCEWVSLSNG